MWCYPITYLKVEFLKVDNKLRCYNKNVEVEWRAWFPLVFSLVSIIVPKGFWVEGCYLYILLDSSLFLFDWKSQARHLFPLYWLPSAPMTRYSSPSLIFSSIMYYVFHPLPQLHKRSLALPREGDLRWSSPQGSHGIVPHSKQPLEQTEQ